jgi:Holliday junction resolvasome RuvABC DNA-binding subunit
MAQDLTVNIKTTSDVPQAMDRAKSATTEFGKQAEAVNKRFKDSIKDILLSTAGPMAALAIVTQRINDYFEKTKQAQEDANKSAIDGVNERMAREDVYWARKTARENEDKKNKQDAARQPETTAYEFLMNDPRAKEKLGFSNDKSPAFAMPGYTQGMLMAEFLSKKSSVQEQVRKIIAEDLAKNGMISKPGEEGKATSSYSAPQGVNAVVGMGNNAVIQAQFDQLDEARKHTVLLQNLVERNPFVSTDFTKQNESASPSRSYLLTK